MSRMTNLAALLTVALWTTSGDDAKAERKADVSQLKVGTHCEVATKETSARNRRSWTTYLGTVKEITDESVTLYDVSVTTRNDKSTPVLCSIPYVNRLFKNVGISRTHLREESMVIPLKDIAWNEAVTADEFRMRSAIPTKSVVRLQTDNVP